MVLIISTTLLVSFPLLYKFKFILLFLMFSITIVLYVGFSSSILYSLVISFSISIVLLSDFFKIDLGICSLELLLIFNSEINLS